AAGSYTFGAIRGADTQGSTGEALLFSTWLGGPPPSPPATAPAGVDADFYLRDRGERRSTRHAGLRRQLGHLGAPQDRRRRDRLRPDLVFALDGLRDARPPPALARPGLLARGGERSRPAEPLLPHRRRSGDQPAAAARAAMSFRAVVHAAAAEQLGLRRSRSGHDRERAGALRRRLRHLIVRHRRRLARRRYLVGAGGADLEPAVPARRVVGNGALRAAAAPRRERAVSRLRQQRDRDLLGFRSDAAASG